MAYANQDLLTPGRQLTPDEIDTLGSDLQRAFRLEAAASWLIPSYALRVYFGTQSQSEADYRLNQADGNPYVIDGAGFNRNNRYYDITDTLIGPLPGTVQTQSNGAEAVTGILTKFDEILAQTDPASVNAGDTETAKLTQITRAISGLQLDRNAIVSYLSTYKTYLTDTRSGRAEFTTDILSDQLNFDGRYYDDSRFGRVGLTDTRSATVASLLYAPIKRAIETDVAAGDNILAEMEMLQQALGYQLDRILDPTLPPPAPPADPTPVMPPVEMLPPMETVMPAPPPPPQVDPTPTPPVTVVVIPPSNMTPTEPAPVPPAEMVEITNGQGMRVMTSAPMVVNSGLQSVMAATAPAAVNITIDAGTARPKPFDPAPSSTGCRGSIERPLRAPCPVAV